MEGDAVIWQPLQQQLNSAFVPYLYIYFCYQCKGLNFHEQIMMKPYLLLLSQAKSLEDLLMNSHYWFLILFLQFYFLLAVILSEFSSESHATFVIIRTLMFW